MPITDHTSKALLSSSTRGSDPTPVFPSFLPLEIFDNTEFDSRTPEEWLQLGKVSLMCSLVISGSLFFFCCMLKKLITWGNLASSIHSRKVYNETWTMRMCVELTSVHAQKTVAFERCDEPWVKWYSTSARLKLPNWLPSICVLARVQWVVIVISTCKFTTTHPSWSKKKKISTLVIRICSFLWYFHTFTWWFLNPTPSI